jgi:polysaccharide deacetylase 2 family uncharacterized protein YibQ
VKHDLHTPLGQDKDRHRPAGPWRSPARWLGLACAAIVAGGAIAFSLSPDRLRDPAAASIDVAEIAAPTETAAPAAEEPLRPSPDPRQSGQSGANIATVDTGAGETVTIFRPGDRGTDGAVMLRGADGAQDTRFAHQPEPALLADSPFGPLPVRGADGRRPLDAYGRPWSGARGTRIAIVVGGLGLSQTGTQYAIETLPETVTLGFAAAGNSLQRWMQQARREGHEILLQVPFEPFDYPSVDPGPGTLTVDAGAEANIEDLSRAMARITNYTGVMNYMGGRYLAEPDAIEPVLRELADRGLLFLDDGTSARSSAPLIAETIGLPHATADIVLDTTRERGAILRQLDTLERAAVRSGSAIGVASAFDVSIDAIAEWVREAAARNIEIVGVAAVVDDPQKR